MRFPQRTVIGSDNEAPNTSTTSATPTTATPTTTASTTTTAMPTNYKQWDWKTSKSNKTFLGICCEINCGVNLQKHTHAQYARSC